MAQKNKEPNCNDCPDREPELLVENYPIVSLAERYGSLFVTGEGSISPAGIKLALDNELWIAEVDRSIYIRKLIVYLRTALETQKKDK